MAWLCLGSVVRVRGSLAVQPHTHTHTHTHRAAIIITVASPTLRPSPEIHYHSLEPAWEMLEGRGGVLRGWRDEGRLREMGRSKGEDKGEKGGPGGGSSIRVGVRVTSIECYIKHRFSCPVLVKIHT